MSGWTATLLPEAAVELGAMVADIRARFGRMVGLIETHGLEKVREPHVRHLKGSLWEMRMTGWDGIARAIYVTATTRRVVVVRVFSKKTQKTPARELRFAERRAEEVV
jgi:phage-related protein